MTGVRQAYREAYGRRVWILAICEHGHITATQEASIACCAVCRSPRLDDVEGPVIGAVRVAPRCVCSFAGPDGFGNYDMIEREECPIHGVEL